MRTIKFIGSTNSPYARGKDKKKRKSRGLLAAGGGGIVGGTLGNKIAQSSLLLKRFKVTSSNPLDKLGNHLGALNVIKQNRNYQPIKIAPQWLKEKSIRRVNKVLKVYNKAGKIGTLKGAAIGAGLGLGGTLLVSKLRNRKKNK
jgi:hypothetical protein